MFTELQLPCREGFHRCSLKPETSWPYNIPTFTEATMLSVASLTTHIHWTPKKMALKSPLSHLGIRRGVQSRRHLQGSFNSSLYLWCNYSSLLQFPSMVTRSASLKLLKIVSILIQPKFSLLFQRMISNNRQNINFCTSFPSPSLKKKTLSKCFGELPLPLRSTHCCNGRRELCAFLFCFPPTGCMNPFIWRNEQNDS